MSQKTINGKVYSIGKMPLRVQLHVSRRIAPILWALFLSALSEQQLQEAKESGIKISMLTPDMVLSVMGPLLNELQRMSDTDLDYVMNETLKVVQRQVAPPAQGWSPLLAPNGALQFENDMDLRELLQITASVINDNLANFTTGLLQDLGTPQPGQGTPKV